jgi:hypothetical protein
VCGYFTGEHKLQHPEGLIGYFRLTDWWLATFTEPERAFIEATYKPFTIGSQPTHTSELTQGRIEHTTETAARFLCGLASWFRKPTDRHLARRMLEKAEMVAGEHPLDLHFIYHGMIEVYYRDRGSELSALKAALRACQQQIQLAPRAAQAFRTAYPGQSLPSHAGFTQLAIIREKQHNYLDAISLAHQAKEQGWAGDWDKRIARCQRRQDKQ